MVLNTPTGRISNLPKTTRKGAVCSARCRRSADRTGHGSGGLSARNVGNGGSARPIDAFFEAVQVNADSRQSAPQPAEPACPYPQICLSVADLTKIEG